MLYSATDQAEVLFQKLQCSFREIFGEPSDLQNPETEGAAKNQDSKDHD